MGSRAGTVATTKVTFPLDLVRVADYRCLCHPRVLQERRFHLCSLEGNRHQARVVSPLGASQSPNPPTPPPTVLAKGNSHARQEPRHLGSAQAVSADIDHIIHTPCGHRKTGLDPETSTAATAATDFRLPVMR